MREREHTGWEEEGSEFRVNVLLGTVKEKRRD